MGNYIGSKIIELQKDIAASLYLEPATLDELSKRDFLSNIADFNVDRLLSVLEYKGWLFIDKQDRYHTYKKIAKKVLKEYNLF